jgi:hypothetical protein
MPNIAMKHLIGDITYRHSFRKREQFEVSLREKNSDYS